MRLSVGELRSPIPLAALQLGAGARRRPRTQRLRVGRTTHASGAHASRIYGWNFG